MPTSLHTQGYKQALLLGLLKGRLWVVRTLLLILFILFFLKFEKVFKPSS